MGGVRFVPRPSFDSKIKGISMRSILSGFMKRHLRVNTWVDGDLVESIPIDDPFVTSKMYIGIEFNLWDRIKLLFKGRHVVRVKYEIKGDHVAVKRWMQGVDSCDNCAEVITEGRYYHSDYLCKACYDASTSPE